MHPEAPADGPVFLITNDDGYRAPGIHALARFAGRLGRVYVMAPDREQSASSHALTLHRPLRVEPELPNWWTVDGTPTDCVNLALRSSVLPERPTMVLSGINHGGNLGDDVTYSGTVAGAMEGALLGLPAIAFSCLSRDPDGDELDLLEPWVARIVATVAERGLPEGTLLNVNFPDPRRGPIRGLRVTRQGKRVYTAQAVERTDPRNRAYYWIGGEVVESEPLPGSDIEAIEAGYVSITPLKLDLTDERLLAELPRWWPATALHEEG